MIKKNTKVIILGSKEQNTDLIGGIPLSKGERINLHKNGKLEQYEVIDKKVDCFFEKEDQIVNITYTLKKSKTKL